MQLAQHGQGFVLLLPYIQAQLCGGCNGNLTGLVIISYLSSSLYSRQACFLQGL